MVTTVTITEEGLRVDHLARRHYGTEAAGNAEAILAANPGLADAGLDIPLGRVVTLPPRERPAARTAPTVNPWD
jgi:phage tail protein X